MKQKRVLRPFPNKLINAKEINFPSIQTEVLYLAGSNQSRNHWDSPQSSPSLIKVWNQQVGHRREGLDFEIALLWCNLAKYSGCGYWVQKSKSTKFKKTNCINCKRITITDSRYAGNCGHELGQNNLNTSVKNTVVLYTTGGNHSLHGYFCKS